MIIALSPAQFGAAVALFDHYHAERWLTILDVYYSRGCVPINYQDIEFYSAPPEIRLDVGLYPYRAAVHRRHIPALARYGYILQPNGRRFPRKLHENNPQRFIPALFTKEVKDVLR